MAYTTTTQVRQLLPNLLLSEDIIGTVESGALIILNYPAISVPTIEKLGVTSENLVLGIDYTFSRPNRVTLTVPADGEDFICSTHLGISDTILTDIIEQAEAIITAEFLYLTNPGATYMATLSSWLAAAIYLKSYCASNKIEMDKADVFMKLATDMLDNLQNKNIRKYSMRLVTADDY